MTGKNIMSGFTEQFYIHLYAKFTAGIPPQPVAVLLQLQLRANGCMRFKQIQINNIIVNAYRAIVR